MEAESWLERRRSAMVEQPYSLAAMIPVAWAKDPTSHLSRSIMPRDIAGQTA